MSWALRHAALELGLQMSSDGYVPVKDLLNCGHRRFRGWDEADVRHVVETSDKQRYKLCHRRAGEFRDAGTADENDMALCVRANQGHSLPNIDAERLLKRILPSELEKIDTIVHGTFLEAWKSHIKNEGLSRMSRNHIHFAAGMPKEEHVISGMRKSCDVFIYVDAVLCAREGIAFFRSDNDVLLTAGLNNEGKLPISFISRVVSSSGTMLYEREPTD